jgi:alkanesulfonate monooxygenase SsuD/methylene tetrahydromethanopterin reductase-like flavin-dependent oxidoreductase (luciferase family)
VKFAHFTQTLPRPGETLVDRFDQLWRELELADEVNFDFGFASVHHFSRLRHTSSLYCTGAAARTSRLRLGPMGYSVALYDPIRIVEEVALLDSVTHGRLEVGLAIGLTAEEFRIYGGDWENRYAIATEAMFLLKKAFTSEKPFDFDGPFHQYKAVPLCVEPVQRPHPPIWLISLQPEQIKMAAQEGAHTGYVFFRPRQEAAPQVRDYLRMWRANGHEYEPNITYLAFVYVDETDEAAVVNSAPHILDSMNALYGRSLGLAESTEIEKDGAISGVERLVTDLGKLLDFEYIHEQSLVFVGSPETVVRKLKAAAEEGLFNVFSGEFNIGRIPEENLMRSIRLFGTEVIPALRDFNPVSNYLHSNMEVTA